MDIKVIMVMTAMVIMFIVMIILFCREKSKSRKIQKEFEDLKIEIEKNKEETNIETKIRQLKEKADTITFEMNDSIENRFNKLSNQKIMEFEEYAGELLQKIEVSHKEVVFLYDMLNDKAESIKVSYGKLQDIQGEVSELIEKAEKVVSKDSSVDDKKEVNDREFIEGFSTCEQIEEEKDRIINSHMEKEEQQDKAKLGSGYQLRNEKIIKLYSLGYSTLEISKKLGIGTGEVTLVNNLYKNRVMATD